MTKSSVNAMYAIAGIVGTLAAIAVGVLIFIYSGAFDVAADVPDTQTTHWLLKTVREHSIDRRADSVHVPADLENAQRIRAGARHYASMCQECHLAPGVKPTPVHEGLSPEPPELAKSASDIPPGHLFWIVRNGIKMTGMPSWGKTHGDKDLWDIVAFVNKLPKMSPQEYQEMTAGAKESEGEGHAEMAGAPTP